MITLNYRDARPIYEQVRDGLRRIIMTGGLAKGEKLPSVRSLASQLAINPNTIQRAYNELEAEGLCTAVPGKGSFVTYTPDERETARKTELFRRFTLLVREMHALGISESEMLAALEEEISHD